LVQKVKPETAKAYLSNLRTFHIEQGLDISNFCDPRIDQLIRGAKRCIPEKAKRLRLPLTREILIKAISILNLHTQVDINIHAAICVSFAAFLRAGEFTWDSWDPKTSPSHSLARGHVKFNNNGSVTIRLPSSKTDPSKLGTDIHLAATTSILCPVSALKRLFRQCPAEPNSPLFSKPLGSFTKSFFMLRVHNLLVRVGISTIGFSGHSIRKGAAVSAISNGISREDVKKMGRWKSDAVQVYIDEVDSNQHLTNMIRLNAQLQVPSPARHPLASVLSPSPSTFQRRELQQDHWFPSETGRDACTPGDGPALAAAGSRNPQ